MASHTPNPPALSTSTSVSGSSGAPDSIDVVILSPSPEVINHGRLNFSKIPFDTTISELKVRIQNELPAKPAPERQRLIYRGRPLLDGRASLRDVLRAQQNSSDYTDSYTLHLVLPPTPTSYGPHGPTVASAPVSFTHAERPATGEQPETTQAQNIGQRATNPQHVVAHAQQAQQMLQQQLSFLQQQMHANNPVIGQGQAITPVQGTTQVTYQVNGPQAIPMPFPPGIFQAPQIPSLQAMLGQQQAMRYQAAMNGQQHNHSAPATQPQTQQVGDNLRDTAATSAPTAASIMPRTRVPETAGPNGGVVRTVVQGHVSFSRQGTPVQTDTPASGAGIRSHMVNAGVDQQDQPVGGVTMQPSALPLPPTLATGGARHLPYPFSAPRPPAFNPAGGTTAWVLSSPSGPEALLFAPGHGLFGSPSRSASTHITPSQAIRRQNRVPDSTRPAAIETQGGASNTPATAPAHVPHHQEQAQLVVRGQGQDQARPQNQDQIQNNENEFFALVVQRGWLFLRLYMFMFVLSEPGTWRRWILLAVAVVICVLPRQNPFHEAFGHVRRHIDTLIGPPQVARRQGPTDGVQPQQHHNVVAGTAGGATRQQVGAIATPEEAAARWLRERQEQNPNILRNTFFRIERAVALFVASLVPGVGERHVQAREDARREVERIANEERERTAREAPEATNDAAGSDDRNHERTTSPPNDGTDDDDRRGKDGLGNQGSANSQAVVDGVRSDAAMVAEGTVVGPG